MSKINENKLVPKLRFPEFQNQDEWTEKKFDDLCKFIRGPFGGALKKEIFVSEGYAVYEQQHAIYGDFTTFRYFISEEKFNEMKRFSVLPKDIIMSCSGTMGKFAVVPENPKEGVINQALLKLTVKSGYEVGFIKTTLELPVNQNKLLSQSAGGAIKNVVEVAQIKEIKLLIPPIKEQQKIASCLLSLDEVITAESQNLDILKDHKRGLLQNLFPQEGKTVPKLRFKGYKDSGEWEEKLIEDYFDVGSSKRVLQQDWTNQGVPFYRTRELVSLSKNEPFGNEVFISEELYSELKQTYGVPKEGDFLISGVGTLGICYQVQSNDKFYFKDGNVIWFKLEGDINSTYFKYCFHSAHIQHQIVSQTSKSTVGTYTIQNAKKTKLWYPPTTKEQQKIANTLTSIDDLINAQSQKVETLRLHKKGLLQGLFPYLIMANSPQ